jgi:hypothetical protein
MKQKLAKIHAFLSNSPEVLLFPIIIPSGIMAIFAPGEWTRTDHLILAFFGGIMLILFPIRQQLKQQYYEQGARDATEKANTELIKMLEGIMQAGKDAGVLHIEQMSKDIIEKEEKKKYAD